MHASQDSRSSTESTEAETETEVAPATDSAMTREEDIKRKDIDDTKKKEEDTDDAADDADQQAEHAAHEDVEAGDGQEFDAEATMESANHLTNVAKIAIAYFQVLACVSFTMPSNSLL